MKGEETMFYTKTKPYSKCGTRKLKLLHLIISMFSLHHWNRNSVAGINEEVVDYVFGKSNQISSSLGRKEEIMTIDILKLWRLWINYKIRREHEGLV